jgi:hypothetical protein
MSTHAHSPDHSSPGNVPGAEGPTGFAAIIPAMVMVLVVLAIIATVVLAGAMWGTAVAVLVTVSMAWYVMRYMGRLTNDQP